MVKLLTLWVLDNNEGYENIPPYIISNGIWETTGVEEINYLDKSVKRIYDLTCVQSYHKKLKIGEVVKMSEELLTELCHEVKLVHLPKHKSKKPDIKISKKISIDEKTKLFLFCRWMAMSYTSENMNTESGYWWKDRVNDFERLAYPNLIKNNSYIDTFEFLSAAPNKAIDFFEYEKVPGLQSTKARRSKKNKKNV